MRSPHTNDGGCEVRLAPSEIARYKKKKEKHEEDADKVRASSPCSLPDTLPRHQGPPTAQEARPRPLPPAATAGRFLGHAHGCPPTPGRARITTTAPCIALAAARRATRGARPAEAAGHVVDVDIASDHPLWRLPSCSPYVFGSTRSNNFFASFHTLNMPRVLCVAKPAWRAMARCLGLCRAAHRRTRPLHLRGRRGSGRRVVYRLGHGYCSRYRYLRCRRRPLRHPDTRRSTAAMPA